MTFAVRPIGLHVGAFVFTPTISADTSDYNLKAAAIAAGWDQVTPLLATVTVGSGIVLSATATSGYGFDTGATFPAGTVLTLICQGYICGMGGAGGAVYTAGSNGGPALRAQYAIGIDAAGGVIGGGGGGGGGAGVIGGGGGGRSGRTNAAGASGGASGTFSSGGSGGGGRGGAGGTTGPGDDGSGGSGGGGGGWGASGGTAGSYAGGTGGAAVVGNSYITWINTGTRYGSIT